MMGETMGESVHWALPLLAAGQAQKEITHNEAILAIDRLLHISVRSRSAAEPPAAAVAGDRHIVGPDPAGDWAGNAAMLADFDGGGWTMTAPQTGCLAWVADEAQFAVFTGSVWSTGGWPARGLLIGDRTVLGATPAMVAAPQGGTTVDSECRLALSVLLVALASQGVILPAI
jgi:hypothetical protein